MWVGVGEKKMETTTLEYGDDQTDHFETSHMALDVIVPFSH